MPLITDRACEYTEKVMDMVTLSGAMEKASDVVDEAAMTFLAVKECQDEFPLDGETRLDKFVNTIKTFGKGGACVGALLSKVATFPVDMFFGQGGKAPPEEVAGPLDVGLIGMGLEFTTVATTIAADAVGMGLGAVVGTINSPISLGQSGTFKEWIWNHANALGKSFAAATSGIMGFTFGIGLNIVRAASLVAKYAISGAFALGALIVGFLGGAFRAIINR